MFVPSSSHSITTVSVILVIKDMGFFLSDQATGCKSLTICPVPTPEESVLLDLLKDSLERFKLHLVTHL